MQSPEGTLATFSARALYSMEARLTNNTSQHPQQRTCVLAFLAFGLPFDFMASSSAAFAACNL